MNTPSPVIDIIIPTYRRYGILAETLESVKSQTYPHWECWIAEDGESEKTRAAIEPFLSDGRFHYLPGEHSGTPAAPRNRAMLAGRAPLIAFLDDDDIWFPDKLELQMDFWKRHPGCVLLGCNAFIMREDQDYRKDRLPLYFQKAPFGRVPYHLHVQDDYFINSAAIIRRDALAFAGLQNELLHKGPDGEDYDLWLRLGPLGEIWLMPETLVVYREFSAKKAASPLSSQEQRRASYYTRFKIYRSALQGVGELPNALLFPEHHRSRKFCQRESDFYEAGPRFLGRLRHNIGSAFSRLFYRAPSKQRRSLNAVSSFTEYQSRWKKPESRKTVECIIFSKDRAMQLHGLLSTLLEKVTPAIPVHVLYTASSAAHLKAYEEVAALFSEHNIRFILQAGSRSFKQDLMGILYSLTCDILFFLVDDILFTEPVHLEDIIRYDPDQCVFSLRLGKNLSRCYVLQKPQSVPPFKPEEQKESDKIMWRWTDGTLDWSYPLSVDGHFFSRREAATMAALLDFSAPNSFEDQLQIFRPFFTGRCGVGYSKSRVVNIPCNRVQNEIDNLSGHVHPDELLSAWQRGYRIDYEKFYGFVNESAHQDLALPLVERKKKD